MSGDLLSKSTKKSTFGTDPLSFNTRSRLPMATTRIPATSNLHGVIKTKESVHDHIPFHNVPHAAGGGGICKGTHCVQFRPQL